MKKIQTFIFLLLLALGFIFIPTQSASSLPSLSISSPSNGQTYEGNSFTITGTASPDAAVLISKSGSTIKQTRADGSGNWTAQLQDLPDGDNQITIRAALNTGFAYINTVNSDFSVGKTNQLRLSDNVLNPTAPYPITQGEVWLGLIPSFFDSTLYAQFGSFSGLAPGIFDTDNPVASAQSINYPSNSGSNANTFNSTGEKLYSPNMQLSSVSVVDVASNTWIEDIAVPSNPVTAVSFLGKIYVAGSDSEFYVIDPATDEIVQTIQIPCAVNSLAPTLTFSFDENYPYYYVPCIGQQASIIKMNASDNSVVWQVETENAYTNGILNADNQKLYFTSSAAQGWGGTPNTAAEKIYVHSASNGSLVNEVQMTRGVVGIAPSPDFQHIYAATPGIDLNALEGGFDILDMLNDTIEHIDTDEVLAFVGTYPRSDQVTLNNVSVVLGVSTASVGQLAKTGAFIALSAPIGLFLVAAVIYTYYDYRRHKQPLLATDANVNYSYFHHLKVVSVPLAKYRLSLSVDRKVGGRSDDVSRF